MARHGARGAYGAKIGNQWQSSGRRRVKDGVYQCHILFSLLHRVAASA